jgi:8-oxo-dGTP diphosphatase
MTDSIPPTKLTVVAAVIHDSAGRILLARRPQDRHMGGLWEFPGGKVERGESPEGALRRELEEELAVDVIIGPLLDRAHHAEPGLEIDLLFFTTEIVSGVPFPADDQEIAWVSPSDLPSYPTPPADAQLVARLAEGC